MKICNYRTRLTEIHKNDKEDAGEWETESEIEQRIARHHRYKRHTNQDDTGLHPCLQWYNWDVSALASNSCFQATPRGGAESDFVARGPS